jgi:hypothetical protein
VEFVLLRNLSTPRCLVELVLLLWSILSTIICLFSYIFWPLYCQSFDIRRLITTLISLKHYLIWVLYVQPWVFRLSEINL